MLTTPRFKIIRYSWSGFSMSREPVICILQQELPLIFLKSCNMYSNFPTIRRKHSVSSEIPRESISVFSFMISISLVELILISSSISISSFDKHLIFKIFSEHIVSFKPTRKQAPLICLYWPKRLFKGSLWKRAVNMKSYTSSNESSTRFAWHLKIRIRSLAFDREKVNCSNDGTLSLHQLSI